MAEAAWKAAADVTDWVWLATQRDGTTDAEFLELLHEQPLGKAAALVYGASAPAPAGGIGRRASGEVLAMLEVCARLLCGSPHCPSALLLLRHQLARVLTTRDPSRDEAERRRGGGDGSRRTCAR